MFSEPPAGQRPWVVLGPTHPFRGGIAHHTTLLYRQLRQSRPAELLSFRRQYPRWLYRGVSDRDPSRQPLLESSARRMLDPLNPLSWLRVARYLIKRQPEVLILPWWVSYWAPSFYLISKYLRWRSSARILFVVHNVRHHEPGRLTEWATRTVLGTAHGCLVQSSDEQQRLRSLLPKMPVVVARHPAYDFFRNPGRTRDEARGRLDLPRQGDLLLFFGLVRQYKGLDLLLRAFPLVLREHELDLLVVGELWDPEILRPFAHEPWFQHVRLIDSYVPDEDVGDYFAAADLVALPYRSCTGSGVLQTALALGRPVVASRVGALGEEVEDGKTGYLVPPEDPSALARAVLRYLQQTDRRSFERKARCASQARGWPDFVKKLDCLHERTTDPTRSDSVS